MVSQNRTVSKSPSKCHACSNDRSSLAKSVSRVDSNCWHNWRERPGMDGRVTVDAKSLYVMNMEK